MATIGDLSRAVAEATGMKPKTIAVIARELRRHGSIASVNRGYGAARMTERDAVALLLAAVGSDTVRTSPHDAGKWASMPGTLLTAPNEPSEAEESEELGFGTHPSLYLSIGLLLKILANEENVRSKRKTKASITLFTPIPAALVEIEANHLRLRFGYGAMSARTGTPPDPLAEYETLVPSPGVRAIRIGTPSLLTIVQALSAAPRPDANPATPRRARSTPAILNPSCNPAGHRRVT